MEKLEKNQAYEQINQKVIENDQIIIQENIDEFDQLETDFNTKSAKEKVAVR